MLYCLLYILCIRVYHVDIIYRYETTYTGNKLYVKCYTTLSNAGGGLLTSRLRATTSAPSALSRSAACCWRACGCWWCENPKEASPRRRPPRPPSTEEECGRCDKDEDVDEARGCKGESGRARFPARTGDEDRWFSSASLRSNMPVDAG